MKVCRPGAIKPGPSSVYIDWAACTHCDACIGACSADAIEPGVVGVSRASAAFAPGAVPKVAIGSRAEAKVARKAAEQAANAKGKSVTYQGKNVRTLGGRAAAKAAVQAAPKAAAAPLGSPAKAPTAVASASAAPTAAKKTAAAAKPVRTAAPHTGSPAGSVTWSAVDLALVLAMLLATVLAKDAVLGIHAVGLMPLAGRTIVRAATLAVYYSVQFGVFAWLAQRHGARLLEAFSLARTPERMGEGASASPVGSVALVLMLFAATEIAAILYGLAMKALGASQPVRLSSDLSAVFGSGGVGLALSILLVALVAPFAEELAFRGVMMPVLGARWGMWPAILITAVVYAGYHFSLWLFFPTFVLGVALGWLAWTRRSLWPAILLHVLYNAAAVGAGFFVTR